VLRNLFDNLKQAQADAKVAGIVITGAGGKFSGGFDISQFQNDSGGPDISEMVNTAFLELVETGPKPVVAALSTIALGGGCELAVACHGRIATPSASRFARAPALLCKPQPPSLHCCRPHVHYARALHLYASAHQQ
jgi:enoyl-CoA hydratase/3-hydroxyacyl-CoA dehydrogenase